MADGSTVKVGIIVPWRDTDPHRARSFQFVKRRLIEVVGYDHVFMAIDTGHERFHRAASRNLGVGLALESGLDVVVVCDADTVPQELPLAGAIQAASDDGLLHLPYTRYRALTQRSSQQFMRGRDPDRCRAELDWEHSTGGVFVIQPQRWFDCGGMDERFDGWGYEDTSFRTAADTLLGPTQKHAGLIVHLWHPYSQEGGTPEKEERKLLAIRYDEAAGNPEAVLSLIRER